MGSFSLLAVNIEYIIKNLEKQNQMVAFVDESLTLEQAKALESEVKAIPNVATVRFITREEAFESFLDQYKDIKLFEDVSSEILRHRYVMTLNNIDQMEQTQNDLLSVKGIAGVNAHLEISKGFVTVRNVVGAVSISLVLILLVVSVFIMANTVKLTTFNRREEIAIMKMVGATNSFIRWPFVFEGMILGLTGSLFAYLLQWGLYYIAVDRVHHSVALSFITLLKYDVIALPMLIVFGGIGLLVGIGGSVFAIKNYLKV
jgi:cell division transport system permease protein